MVREQQLRLLEQHLLNALDAAKTAGLSTNEVVEMLKLLSNVE